jgi:threonine synthase
MTPPASTLACAGCGAPAATADAFAFRCARADAGDDVDHLLRRRLDPGRVEYPLGAEANPFLRYRTLLHSYHTARARGESDAAFAARVERLDQAVAAVDGRGFRVTPLAAADRLAAELGLGAGRLWVKDETGNVSGSHKARHLMGVLLHLEGAAAAAGEGAPRLAIASCGNAALAAAVLARAAGRPLDVFVPPWAHPQVLERLAALGARLATCERRPGVAGDPCYHRFRAAVAAGAVPFCCQGSDNGLAIEGGATLAWELIDALGARPLDRLFVQVGGGALASACALGFADAVRLGRLERAPRLCAVQTAGGHPLARAYDRLAGRLLARRPDAPPPDPANRGPAAEFLRAEVDPQEVRAALRHAATHRSEYMWPWESEPKSLATGILDDETYDWLAVVEAMLATGGYPVVVDEATVARAHQLGREATGIDVDPTGTAGLAGLIQTLATGTPLGAESVVVLFTGARRG